MGILAIILVTIAVLLWREQAEPATSANGVTGQIDKLLQISSGAAKQKKYSLAEKALLTVLRVDERNAQAYNRLGILYAKQQHYNDAIECFEIAQSLQPSASSLHNVGLIYLKVGNLPKARQAFEQAIELEDNVASRHIAYAKVLEEQGEDKKMIEELEKAARLEKNPQSFGILADALERIGDKERAKEVRELAHSMAKGGNRKRIKQPSKVSI